MENKFRRRPVFQLFNVPNDLKHQAHRAGEEWAADGGYCAQCKEFRKPMVVTAGKDPKDGKRFIYMLCAGCVQKLDQMKAGQKPEEFFEEALGNMLQSKAEMEKEQEKSPTAEQVEKAREEFVGDIAKGIEKEMGIENRENVDAEVICLRHGQPVDSLTPDETKHRFEAPPRKQP